MKLNCPRAAVVESAMHVICLLFVGTQGRLKCSTVKFNVRPNMLGAPELPDKVFITRLCLQRAHRPTRVLVKLSTNL